MDLVCRYIVLILGGLTLLLPHTKASTIVCAGGSMAEENPLWEAFVDYSGGRGVARIGVVTAASAEPAISAADYIGLFLDAGAEEAVWIPITVDTPVLAYDPDVVELTERMTGIFFGGGDQLRLVETLYDSNRDATPVLQAMYDIQRDREAAVGGSSAGCAALSSSVMIMGGMSYDALAYGAYIFGEEIGRDDLMYDPHGGLAFFDDYITDTHFSERGREGRLIRLVSDTKDQQHGTVFGFGVDEDTSFVIHDAGTSRAVGEVLGSYGVLIIDIRDATVVPLSSEWQIRDVYAHYLTSGDQIDMNTYEVEFANYKSNLAGNEFYLNALTSNNIFDGSRTNSMPEFVGVSTSLFDSRLDDTTFGHTEERNPRFYVDFYQESFSSGYGGYHPVYGNWLISYHNLRIDISDN